AGGCGPSGGTRSAPPVGAGRAALSVPVDPTAPPRQIEQAPEQAARPIGGFVQSGRVDALGTLSALTPAPPAAPATTSITFAGVLTARTRERAYTCQVPAGRLTATLSFKGAHSLSLSLVQ